MSKQYSRYPYYLIIPALFVYGIFFIYPTLSGFYFSFTDWNLASQMHGIHFAGLANYKRLLFDNNDLYVIIKNTFYYAIMLVVLQNVIGLALAFLFNGKLMLRNVGRTLVFIPVIVSQLAASYVFVSIFNRKGLFNQLLTAIGVPSTIGWLGDKNVVMTCLVLISLWQGLGFNMSVFLAGMQSISVELIESASVEGAGKWQTARHVILPLLAPSMTVNILLTMIGAMKVFDLVDRKSVV